MKTQNNYLKLNIFFKKCYVLYTSLIYILTFRGSTTRQVNLNTHLRIWSLEDQLLKVKGLLKIKKKTWGIFIPVSPSRILLIPSLNIN